MYVKKITEKTVLIKYNVGGVRTFFIIFLVYLNLSHNFMSNICVAYCSTCNKRGDIHTKSNFKKGFVFVMLFYK